jgi:hypothetical protein
VTDLIIQAVEDLAFQQGLTTLKFTNNTRKNIYPADWIAGVEYEDPEDEEHRPDYNQPFGDDDDLDEDIYQRIDQAELEDLVGEHEETVSNDEEPVEEERNDTDKEDELQFFGRASFVPFFRASLYYWYHSNT